MSRTMAGWQRKRYGVENSMDDTKDLSVRRAHAVVKSSGIRHCVMVDCATKKRY